MRAAHILAQRVGERSQLQRHSGFLSEAGTGEEGVVVAFGVLYTHEKSAMLTERARAFRGGRSDA